MTPPGDLTDVTPIPAPTTMHVGATGTTCCLVTDAVGKYAAYLLNAAPVTTTYMSQQVTIGLAGELHLVSSDGTDTKIASGIYQNGYAHLARRQGAVLRRVRSDHGLHAGDRVAAVLPDRRRRRDEQDRDRQRAEPDGGGQCVPTDEHRL